MALLALVLCVFAIPSVIKSGGGVVEFIPFWVLIYLTVIPFYVALYQAMKILTYIDKNTAFSQASITALNYIKYSALAITVLYALGTPFVIRAAETDDAPGAVLLWLAIIGAPVVIAVFAAVLRKLIQNGLDLKSENDLTV
jgi:hypothetical protein